MPLKNFNFYQRLAYSLVFIVIYLFALRPIRDTITANILVPFVQQIKAESVPVMFYYFGGTSFYVIRTDIQGDWQRNAEDRTARTVVGIGDQAQKNSFSFRGFGDKFFSLGAFYFLSFGFGWKPVGWLFLLHQSVTVLSLTCLILAVSTNPAWLYPMNLLVTYITPAATGMFVLTWRKR